MKNSPELPPETEVEVIASKGNQHFKKIMTLKEIKTMEKKPGFSYRTFQIGYSQFKLK